MTTLTDPLIGQVLDDRYRIDDAVARGGMAMVYKGTDLAAGPRHRTQDHAPPSAR